MPKQIVDTVCLIEAERERERCANTAAAQPRRWEQRRLRCQCNGTKFKFHLNRHKFCGFGWLWALPCQSVLCNATVFVCVRFIVGSLMWLMVKYCVQKSYFHNDRRLQVTTNYFASKNAPVAPFIRTNQRIRWTELYKYIATNCHWQQNSTKVQINAKQIEKKSLWRMN